MPTSISQLRTAGRAGEGELTIWFRKDGFRWNTGNPNGGGEFRVTGSGQTYGKKLTHEAK